MLTRSAAVHNLLPCQFTSLLAGVIGDIKSRWDTIFRSQSFPLLAHSSFWSAHHWWLIPTPIRLYLKWCGWIGGRSEIGAGHCSGKIDSGIRIWLGENSRFKYPEMYDCNFGVDVEGWSGGSNLRGSKRIYSAGQWSGEDLVMWSLGDFQDTSCPLWDCRPCNFNCKVHFNKKWSLRLTMLLYDRYSEMDETKRSS